jgi:parallel beta-helix repeat protein
MFYKIRKITASFVLFLSFVLVSLLEIGIVKADNTIYIRADGSVEGTDKIHRDGNVYTFTGNIYDSIVVERDNIVIDGVGYILQGTGTGSGINLSERNNVTVKNFEINQFYAGIYFLDYSEPGNNTISGNNITNNSYGIYIHSSHNNTISGNNLTNNNYGISLFLSHFNVLTNNRMVDNGQNLIVQGGCLAALTHYMDTSNTVNGKPVYYWVEEQDKTVPSDAGYVALTRCTNITVQNLNLTNNGQGILLASTRDSTITKNTIKNNNEGIYLWDSSNNIISWNTITNNNRGIHIHGTYPTYSPSNRIYGNNIANNGYGIYIDSRMERTNNNIHHNNFINNTEQASVPEWWHMVVFEEIWVPPPSNVWDNGKEGNYWSNYVTIYPNATEIGSSGIWDTPHGISENNQDNYPLMAPIYLFDAGTWEWTNYNVYIISNSTVSDFSFNPDEGALLRFDVEGEDGTTGFCRVTIPKDLLYTEGNWVVLVDGYPAAPTVNEDTDNSYLYFTYSHNTKIVEIIGTTAIPEFPSWIILPLLITATLLIIICKQKLPKISN